MASTDLLEMIQLVADTSELKANPDRMAQAAPSSRRSSTRAAAPSRPILVQNGHAAYRRRQSSRARAFGRVRVMLNDRGERVEEAGPSTPVEITGLDDVPEAGDVLNAVEDERLATRARRAAQARAEGGAVQRLREGHPRQPLQPDRRRATSRSCPSSSRPMCRARSRPSSSRLKSSRTTRCASRSSTARVGAVSESDVMLADASNAIIVGFNVRPDPVAKENAERDGVEHAALPHHLRRHRRRRDGHEGHARRPRPARSSSAAPRSARSTRSPAWAPSRAATCSRARSPATRRSASCATASSSPTTRLASLKRFKDDVKEVAKGYECGIGLEQVQRHQGGRHLRGV